MSQNISLWGAQYSGVPSILLPKTGGGTASFTDVTGTTATASDVAQGKIFYTADGTQTTGTASGGGGSNWTLIGSTELTISTKSTTPTSVGTIACGATAADKDAIIYVRVRDKEGKRAGYFAGSDAFFINHNKANGSDTTLMTPAVMCYRYTTSSAWAETVGQYGIFGYSISNAGVVTIRSRYNAGYTATINSTYQVDVFKLTYPTGYPAVFDI